MVMRVMPITLMLILMIITITVIYFFYSSPVICQSSSPYKQFL